MEVSKKVDIDDVYRKFMELQGKHDRMQMIEGNASSGSWLARERDRIRKEMNAWYKMLVLVHERDYKTVATALKESLHHLEVCRDRRKIDWGKHNETNIENVNLQTKITELEKELKEEKSRSSMLTNNLKQSKEKNMKFEGMMKKFAIIRSTHEET